ncbi:MAG: cohesin domain-containing protein [Acutalibacteraceae bacterium]
MSKKKIIAIVAAAVAAIALIAGLGVYLTSVFSSDGGAAKSDKPTITVGSVSGEVGKTVEVPVKFTGNPGAMGFFLQLEYDSESLEYISFEKGDLLTDCEVSGGGGNIKLISVEEGDVKKDGTLVKLTFKVREGASGDCELKLICDENSVCNYDEESIAVTAQSGKITVK